MQFKKIPKEWTKIFIIQVLQKKNIVQLFFSFNLNLLWFWIYANVVTKARDCPTNSNKNTLCNLIFSSNLL